MEVNKPDIGAQGEEITTNDLSVGKYDVISTVGPSFGSKREEMVKMIIESMQYAPALAGVLAPMIFKYSDWPGAQEIAGKLEQAAQQQQALAAQGAKQPQ